MAVRTFVPPVPTLDRSVTSDPVVTSKMPGQDGSNRSSEAAKKEAASFSEAAREPLASSKHHEKSGITFASQDKLPKLPIPELESSCQKYLESLKPLQSPKEQHDSELAVKEFLKRDGLELQEKLKKYASSKSNYIEQFCKSSTLAHKVYLNPLLKGID